MGPSGPPLPKCQWFLLVARGYNKAGPRVNCPQNCLRALKITATRARRARKVWGGNHTVIRPINEIRKSVPLKECEGPQKYDNRGPNDPWQFLLILTPAGRNVDFKNQVSTLHYNKVYHYMEKYLLFLLTIRRNICIRHHLICKDQNSVSWSVDFYLPFVFMRIIFSFSISYSM